ncbi:MAG: hypothetical protein LUF02_06115, partial [Erysipelotrichaceae bacterium]|nr:hypothetical protein [Erysipelotrichaceae bacterium]
IADTDETIDTSASDEVQALIDALPEVDTLDSLSNDELNEVYTNVQAANDAWEALSSEEQALVDDSKLDELFNYFNSLIMETADEEEETAVVAMIGENSYATLQDAIDSAKDGETILIVNDISVSETINVTSKTITITSYSKYTISADSSSSLLTMIEIDEDRSVILSGKLIVDGTYMQTSKKSYSKDSGDWYYLYNGVGMIDVAGTLTLQDDVTIENYTLGNFAGAINVHGSNAVLNIEGGTITNINRNYSSSGYGFCAPVRVGNNATVNMTSGTITGNKVICYVENDDGEVKKWSGDLAYYSSGGILVSYSGTINMTGGTISNNEAFRGSAIHMYGGTACYISGDALITNNTCGKYGTLTMQGGSIQQAAGAVYMNNGGNLYMSGGTISNNEGYSGGGVTISSSWSGSVESKRAVFEMTGGTITENSAHIGGGIYSYSAGVCITAGKITNNTADLGGGIYSEGNSTAYGVVYLKNVIVTSNTAYLEGGGLWTCPTGESELYVTDGGAIYSNSATYNNDVYYDGVNSSAAGDDVASGSQSLHSLTLDKSYSWWRFNFLLY